jgi:hypothetical protein
MPDFDLKAHLELLNLNKMGNAQKLYKSHVIKI